MIIFRQKRSTSFLGKSEWGSTFSKFCTTFFSLATTEEHSSAFFVTSYSKYSCCDARSYSFYSILILNCLSLPLWILITKQYIQAITLLAVTVTRKFGGNFKTCNAKYDSSNALSICGYLLFYFVTDDSAYI